MKKGEKQLYLFCLIKVVKALESRTSVYLVFLITQIKKLLINFRALPTILLQIFLFSLGYNSLLNGV